MAETFGGGRSGVGSTPAVDAHSLPANPSGGSSQALAGNATGGILYEAIDITSAVAVSPSQPGEICVGLLVQADDEPGWLQVIYDGVNAAIFPTPASGLDATGVIGITEYTFYPMNILSPGSTFLAATNVVFGGGLARARFLFATAANPSPRAIKGFAQMRGVAVQGTETTTAGTAKTYSMPGGQLLSPLGITALVSITTGTATTNPQAEISVPAVPPLANPYLVPATLGRRGDANPPRRWPMPKIGPATSYSLTHTALDLGSATGLSIVGVLWV